MEFIFAMFPVLFVVMFFLVFGTIIITTFQTIKQWNKNNHSPRLIVDALVVSKRTVFRRVNRNSGMHAGSTSYYAAFQMETGDRFELNIPHNMFGLLVEGDKGKLTFQGTRFISFVRR